MKRIALLMTTLLFATSALGQGFGLPPGKWWKMPRVVEMLDLSEDQQDRLDEVFGKAAPELIDLKAELEKATLSLRGEVDQSEIDRSAVRSAVARVNSARASLFERELMMLVDMRGVLTEEQWNELRRALDDRQKQMRDRRPGDRRGPPPPRDRP